MTNKNCSKKVDQNMIRKMQFLRDHLWTAKQIAEKFGVSASTVETYTINNTDKKRRLKKRLSHDIYKARTTYNMTWPRICETFEINVSYAHILYKTYMEEHNERA